MLTYEQALAETAEQRVLMRQMLAALEKGRQKLATYTSIYTGDKELRGLLAAWDAAIAAAKAAGIALAGEEQDIAKRCTPESSRLRRSALTKPEGE